MDDLTVEQMDQEVLQTLRDLALWALEDQGAEPAAVPSLARAMELFAWIDGAQPELDLDDERLPTDYRPSETIFPNPVI